MHKDIKFSENTTFDSSNLGGSLNCIESINCETSPDYIQGLKFKKGQVVESCYGPPSDMTLGVVNENDQGQNEISAMNASGIGDYIFFEDEIIHIREIHTLIGGTSSTQMILL